VVTLFVIGAEAVAVNLSESSQLYILECSLAL